jgi:hypothetical protein
MLLDALIVQLICRRQRDDGVGARERRIRQLPCILTPLEKSPVFFDLFLMAAPRFRDRTERRLTPRVILLVAQLNDVSEELRDFGVLNFAGQLRSLCEKAGRDQWG